MDSYNTPAQVFPYAYAQDAPRVILLVVGGGGIVSPMSDVTRELAIVYDTEDDGRAIAEIPAMPGCVAYGATPAEARANVIANALEIAAEEIRSSVRSVFDVPRFRDA